MQGHENEMKAMLESLEGQKILISKDENGDRDQTVMTLSEVSLNERGETIDGYVSPVSLQLEGDGRAVMEDTDIPMPSSTYDIPIDEVYDAHFDGLRLYVTTSRGSYTISRL